jgi:hypothetical protein
MSPFASHKSGSLVGLINVAGVFVLGAVAGCGGSAPPTRPFAQAGDMTASSREFRFSLYSFSDRFASVVEIAADEIAVRSSDARVQRNALMWKMNAIGVMDYAAVQPDPVGSGIDALILCVQMREFFETGAGRGVFGGQGAVAVDASRLLENEMRRWAASMTTAGELTQEGLDFVNDWTSEHPITSLQFGRRSSLTAFQNTVPEARGGLGGISTMEEAVLDLRDQLPIYMRRVPKQARWQSELAFLEMSDGSDFFGDVAAIEESIEDIRVILREGREAIATEYPALGRELADRLVALEGRLETEREAILNRVTEERVAALDAVTREREAVIEYSDAMYERALADVDARARSATDRVIWRAAQLLAGTLLLATLLAVVVIRWASRSRS